MHRGAVALALLVLLGCTSETRSELASPPPSSDHQPDTSEAVQDIGTAELCADPRPVVTAQIGSVNTIVVPTNSKSFEGEVEVVPAAACPGDAVSFIVSIVNVSEEPTVFSSGRGLIFSSGMMAKWSVVQLRDLEVTVQPGERLDQTVVGTIPPVGPGTYRVGPEGAGFGGEITVLDPTAG